ncbi:TPM domain-containing protein [Brevundimonas sp.]|uniref:TPM domain-containing protein n=1 Tax=Brevundimonas sp. TaxID=1871086 RepID=UPI0025BF0CB8|nr:TPM domain-containing protein [Brevundimonas sp.]
MRFTPQDHARIAAAIAAAEARTSGEIFCVLARRVSAYRDVRLGWAALAALLAPMALIPLGFDPAWFPGVADSWEAAHLAARDIIIGRALAAYALVQAATFISVFLIVSLPVVRRWVTPRAVRRARARQAAVRQFMAHGLHQTDRRTGVLIFACLDDRQVEVVADEAVHGLAGPDTWADAVQALTGAMRAGRPVEGFEAAVGLCGDALAAHFPPAPDDRNELPDRLVLI